MPNDICCIEEWSFRFWTVPCFAKGRHEGDKIDADCNDDRGGRVIGVPIKSKNMDGIDSLLSIVQMPPGVPVATVAVGDAKSAGILAVQILALSNETIATQLKNYKNL